MVEQIFRRSQVEIFTNTLKSIVSAQNDNELLLIILNYCIDYMDADAVSFLPYDEWKIQYPIIKIDENGVHVQNEQVIGTIEKKQVCKNCSQKHGGENCVLLVSNKFPFLAVKCFSFICDEREIGIINLFYKTNQPKIQNQKQFLRLLSLAGDMLAGMHKKEIDIAASMRSKNAIKKFMGIHVSLKKLLLDVQEGFSLSFIFIYFQNGIPETEQKFIFGQSLNENNPYNQTIQQNFILSDLWERIINDSYSQPDGWTKKYSTENFPEIHVIPIKWDNNPVSGLLVFGSDNKNTSISLNIFSYLEIFARQTALLIVNTQNLSSIEFNSVVEERTRLAREIHDGLAQTLAFLKMQNFQMQNLLFKGDYEKLSHSLQANYRTLSDAYADARFAIDDLRIIPANGTIDWITRVMKDFETATEKKVKINISSSANNYSGDIQSQLIRIIQEALSNIRKHADAREIGIFGYEEGSNFVFRVIDDGRGFNLDGLKIGQYKSYGLRGMRERAESIGAALEIESGTGLGTAVSIKIPLAVKEAV